MNVPVKIDPGSRLKMVGNVFSRKLIGPITATAKTTPGIAYPTERTFDMLTLNKLFLLLVK